LMDDDIRNQKDFSVSLSLASTHNLNQSLAVFPRAVS
jgi:hypothetical protein